MTKGGNRCLSYTLTHTHTHTHTLSLSLSLAAAAGTHVLSSSSSSSPKQTRFNNTSYVYTSRSQGGFGFMCAFSGLVYDVTPVFSFISEEIPTSEDTYSNMIQ